MSESVTPMIRREFNSAEELDKCIPHLARLAFRDRKGYSVLFPEDSYAEVTYPVEWELEIGDADD